MSAPSNGQYLRITVKAVGDGTDYVHQLGVGTKVAIEGPYGVFTANHGNTANVLLIAGGIGITPLRALVEEFPSHLGAITLIYRAGSWSDVIFKDELEQIAKVRKMELIFLVGRRGSDNISADPLSGKELLRLVPDIAERDIYICGPPAMMEGGRRRIVGDRCRCAPDPLREVRPAVSSFGEHQCR